MSFFCCSHARFVSLHDIEAQCAQVLFRSFASCGELCVLERVEKNFGYDITSYSTWLLIFKVLQKLSPFSRSFGRYLFDICLISFISRDLIYLLRAIWKGLGL